MDGKLHRVATWLTVALFATTPLAGPEIPSVYVELTGVSDRHRGRDAATARIGETAPSGLDPMEGGVRRCW
jgi:hypothetical protein